ncbi:protein bunched, class 2/F/G isoform-like isoform X1 [Mercenaria mercenaria]|uniref:protein bunched, class 2/F/G isoform-like isoform X1 n=1 Tax=Mercenaria mercenaria TaxID=6596 RepID=UPI00234E8C63|nr:protein bunched, class 2/F/G isoform-like isoform X1 [Mercenaria mercenaria]
MADRPSTVQMAVTSENQDLKGTMTREELDYRANSNSPKPVVDGVPRKKGTFKITSVKLNDTGDADSMDDLDESHTELTEDYSSEVLDASRATDYEQETPSVAEDIPLALNNPGVRDVKEKSDMHSRFRVVKIETKEPFRRGRWFCHDFLDPQSSSVNIDKSDTKVNQDDTNSGSSSAGSSIHYVYGVDDPAKNPLLAGATGTIYTQIPEGQVAGVQDSFQPINPAPNTAVNQPSISNNPQNQATSIGFTSDASQGNSSMCQTINKSHSHQSISSVASTDTINKVSSGQPNQGELKTVHHSGQVIGAHSQLDGSNTGNVKNTAMYMPHFTQGTTVSIQSVFPPSHSQSNTVMSTENTSVASNIPIPNQGQSSTYQTYVHLGQQIPNSVVSQSGHSETMPSSKVKQTGNIQQSLADGGIPNDVSAELSKNDFRSGATDNLYGALDKDLNVIQNPEALSPALVAAVGDLQSPTEEDRSGSSTVAIDNKIEQAMDLVKSHLMFAVREEVEVLKEQIAELIERNNQLEYENGILRAAASPETLAKLSQPRQPLPSSSS